MDAPPRLVLDTNVCLDLFVFGDPRCARLRDALERGEAVAVTDAACRAEWLRVLGYPQLGLEPVRRVQMLARYDSLVVPLAGARPEATGLPRCEDPDDQKFLELAQAASARALLSRDKALLKLARRTDRLGLFRILVPEAWDGAPA